MAAAVEMRHDNPRSLAHELELVRLEHRAQRLDAVVRELRSRVRHHSAPHLIGRAIDGFDAELAAVRRLLRDARNSV